MDEATKQDAFGGYGFAIRTFWFDVTDLHFHRRWSRESSITHKPEFSDFVSGKAVSKDRVGVIGRDGTVNEFDFTLSVDTDAKASWEMIKGINDFGFQNQKFKPEHVRLKKLIDERLDADPPTAALFTYEADWETGTKAGWSIECNVSSEVLAKLTHEIAAKTVDTISIGVKWTAGLVRDEHAPPSFPTVWGLFCLEESRSPESMYGHVSSIRWSPTQRAEATTEEADDVFPAAISTPPTAVAPVIFNVPKSAIVALWVLAIAAVLHLLR